jgi:SAM-dependent methyltransferase
VPSRGRPRPAPETRHAPLAAERFRKADAYRARREWQRYEGTGQRDLYRELRERFLTRHSVDEGWVLDLGSGPGRFLPFAGRGRVTRVALDLSREMLKLIPDAWVASGGFGPVPQRVRGNGLRPPFEDGKWAEVLAMGNTLGFAGPDAEALLDRAEALVAPEGTLLVEVAPSAGERSDYLSRLPASSLPRLFRAPMKAILGRLDREGFRKESARRPPEATFHRFAVTDLHERWRKGGWEVTETIAVAPCLGPDPIRIDALQRDAASWKRFQELEEEVGRRPARWTQAAAVLLCARRASSKRTIK